MIAQVTTLSAVSEVFQHLKKEERHERLFCNATEEAIRCTNLSLYTLSPWDGVLIKFGAERYCLVPVSAPCTLMLSAGVIYPVGIFGLSHGHWGV